MLRWSIRILAILIFALGLIGFSAIRLPGFVQFDLFQSFVYLILGAVGLKLGFSNTPIQIACKYLRLQGAIFFTLVLLGLTFPNLGDLFHLEVPEDMLHGALAIFSSVVGERYTNKNKTGT